MLHISGLFEKYLRKGKSISHQKELITEEVTRILHTSTPFIMFEVKGNLITLTGSSYEKQAIFLRKKEILIALHKHTETAHITDLQ